MYVAVVEINNTSWNKNLLNSLDLWNNVVDILLHFLRGRYFSIAHLEQMFHQIYFFSKDRDAFQFLWRNNSCLPISEFYMNVQLFWNMPTPVVPTGPLNVQLWTDYIITLNELLKLYWKGFILVTTWTRSKTKSRQ